MFCIILKDKMIENGELSYFDLPLPAKSHQICCCEKLKKQIGAETRGRPCLAKTYIHLKRCHLLTLWVQL